MGCFQIPFAIWKERWTSLYWMSCEGLRYGTEKGEVSFCCHSNFSYWLRSAGVPLASKLCYVLTHWWPTKLFLTPGKDMESLAEEQEFVHGLGLSPCLTMQRFAEKT